MTTPFEEPPIVPKKPTRFGGLRTSFLTGLVVIAPVGLTIWLMWTLIGWVDGFVLPLIPAHYQPERYLGINLRGVGVVIFLIFTVLVGWVAKGLIGRSLIRFAESLVNRMPVVRSIYSGVKQIAETVFAQTESNFERACLVQYPRKDIWAVGFISTEAKGEINQKAETGSDLLSVFVPTTPGWELVLNYEYEVRVAAFTKVMNDNVPLAQALRWAWKNTLTKERYLITPLGLESSRGRGSAP